MKLVPLGDKIVLKQLEAEEKIRYRSSGTGKRETPGSGSYRSRTGWQYRRKRSCNAGKGRR